MDDKHDPNASVPAGTFHAASDASDPRDQRDQGDDRDVEIPIEIVVDEDIEPNTLALEASPDDSEPARLVDEPPRRQRVATLMGVPLPGSASARAAAEAKDPRKASSYEIDLAIENGLDERPTTIYGYTRESLAELASIVEAEMTEIPSSEATGEILGVVGRSSDTGTFQIEVPESSEPKTVPVLAPSQFVEARARDQREPPTAQALARDLVSADRGRGDAGPGRTLNGLAPEAASRSVIVEPDLPVQKPISSLAPVELKRKVAKPKEPASGIGYALVAAMVLLGIGGWFLTAGGYRRASDTASQPTAAATVGQPSSNDALGSAKLPAPTEMAAPEAAEPAPPAQVALTSPRPRVASKTVRRTLAPTPQPEPQAIETPSRNDVLNGLDRVRSNVQACAEGRNGVAEVDLTIAANGIVTNALVGGDFGGTPQGSCIARAVRRARFPTFKQDRYRVLFPYVL